MNINCKAYKELNDELLSLLTDLEKQIFEEPYTRDKIKRELSGKRNIFALVAFNENSACGFKVGFEMNSTLFYSWIGGVAAGSRGNGVAKLLMKKQHDFARNEGYDIVRTETENRFREMLLLNIKSGFNVVGVRISSRYPKTIITLEKEL